MVRVGARLAPPILSAALLAACGDEYPLDPTPCDDWCHAIDRPACGHAQPAECVAGCESEGFDPDDGRCLELWEAVIGCYSAVPDQQMCGYSMDPYETSARAQCDQRNAEYLGCHWQDPAAAGAPRVFP